MPVLRPPCALAVRAITKAMANKNSRFIFLNFLDSHYGFHSSYSTYKYYIGYLDNSGYRLLILGEVLLDFLPIVGLHEGKHQEDTSLLWVEVERSYEVILGVIDLGVLIGGTGWNTA